MLVIAVNRHEIAKYRHADQFNMLVNAFYKLVFNISMLVAINCKPVFNIYRLANVNYKPVLLFYMLVDLKDKRAFKTCKYAALKCRHADDRTRHGFNS